MLIAITSENRTVDSAITAESSNRCEVYISDIISIFKESDYNSYTRSPLIFVSYYLEFSSGEGSHTLNSWSGICSSGSSIQRAMKIALGMTSSPTPLWQSAVIQYSPRSAMFVHVPTKGALMRAVGAARTTEARALIMEMLIDFMLAAEKG